MFSLGVVGTSRIETADPAEARVRALGAMLPTEGFLVRTGACGGYPDALAAGYRGRGGAVVGYSPGRDLEDHIAGGSPVGNCDELLFGFGGVVERQVSLVRDSSVLLALGGNVGTLSELCIAIKMQRPIVLVRGIPGIAEQFEEILSKLNVYPAPRVARAGLHEVVDAVFALGPLGLGGREESS